MSRRDLEGRLVLSPAERAKYHQDRLAEVFAQARAFASLPWPEQVGSILDRLAYAHAVDLVRASNGGVR